MTDDDVDVESALAFDYAEGDREAIDVIGDYIPEGDDWAAKTVLRGKQPQLLTALELLPQFYPEVDNIEGEVEDFVNEYEKRLTSVGGLSRSEATDILTSLSGGGGRSDGKRSGILEQLLLPRDDED